jgi:hypothetical protein
MAGACEGGNGDDNNRDYQNRWFQILGGKWFRHKDPPVVDPSKHRFIKDERGLNPVPGSARPYFSSAKLQVFFSFSVSMKGSIGLVNES